MKAWYILLCQLKPVKAVWVSVKKIIPKKAKSLGLEKTAIFWRLKKDWDGLIKKTAGEKFQGKSLPTEIKKDTLQVECLNATWANELRFYEERLKKEINKKQENKIKKIIFKT